ncbi:MAG TPA: sigma 54-interacting transcriptional regulator [Thermoanaerobaculia bacterium]|jgi:DNA-binding NtrC family response regulator|nr:sigma 54-interacting transcriptional regulator [Thermoanaerobaculia bacterium]
MGTETQELTAQAQVLPSLLSATGDRRQRSRARVPALTILYHPDLSRVGECARLPELAFGRTALLSRAQPDFAAPGSTQPQPLADQHLSRSPLRLEAAKAGAVRLQASESRTRVAVEGVEIAAERDCTAAEIRRGVVIELADRVVLLLHEAPEVAGSAPSYPGLIGENEGIVRLRNEIRRVADLDVPVLVRGETGTGKELVARAIHAASRRRGPACVCVNMGSIVPSLAAAELFGAVRGAYTGSVRDQEGFFQRADGSTLFLDEIGETPAEVQTMLLRVLETGEVQRVGSPAVQKVDVRLIAATDADLEQAIAEGRFRSPLLHRLAGYEIVAPPLRERRDDFGRLLLFFLRQELAAIGEESRLRPPEGSAPLWLPASIVARLARLDWPGNVRQLRNAVRQIVIDSRRAATVEIGPQIERLLREASRAPESAGLAAAPQPPAPARLARKRTAAGTYRAPSEVPAEEVVAALRDHDWEVKPAAQRLGISRPSLYLLMSKIPGLRKAADLSRAEILEERAQCGGDLAAAAQRLEVSRSGLLLRMKQLGLLGG